jgi:hypothetical protein
VEVFDADSAGVAFIVKVTLRLRVSQSVSLGFEPHLLISGVVLLHDNARSHTAVRTRALLEHFNWDLFDHCPYSPDLDLSDYHLFT